MNDSEAEILTFYSTESTSPTSSIVQQILLNSTGTTRRILRPTIVKNSSNADACLQIEIIHERTGKNGFEPIDPPNLSKLKAGEALSCSLNSKETLALYNELSKLYALGNDAGIRYGENSYCIIKTEKNLILSKEEEKAISNLLEQCQASPGLAEKLAKTSPELIENAYRYKLLQKKHQGFARFKVLLKEEVQEQEWQDFFEEHDWIFGGVYDVQILAKVVNQPILSSPNVWGKGEKRGDLLLGTQGAISFTSVAEIKKSHTPLLKANPYRQGIYSISEELNGGVAQLRAYINKWQIEGSRTDVNKDLLESQEMYTIQPRGILVIGNLDQLKGDREKREAFELFRQNQKDIHIVTFDELYHRAKYLLGIPG